MRRVGRMEKFLLGGLRSGFIWAAILAAITFTVGVLVGSDNREKVFVAERICDFQGIDTYFSKDGKDFVVCSGGKIKEVR